VARKCQFTHSARFDLRMLIGDGRSDFCIARRVDLVLAKSALLPHCVATGLPVRAFENFHQARELLAGWLDGHDAIVPVAEEQRAED
jgi:2-hydroxy-3-keto-5-methylthiopentenyl-1-phosphate phosphatase